MLMDWINFLSFISIRLYQPIFSLFCKLQNITWKQDLRGSSVFLFPVKASFQSFVWMVSFFLYFFFVWSGICISWKTIIPPETFIDHLNYLHFFIIILHHFSIFFLVPCLHLNLFLYHYLIVPS